MSGCRRLGLAMVYGYARHSNGHCRIDSEVGRGSRISLYLPRHIPTVEAASPSDASPVPDLGWPATADILLVEQDAVVRNLAAEVFRDCGHRVTLSEDGADALRMIAVGETVDLVVTRTGAGGILTKPFAVEALIERVSEVLGRRPTA